MERAIHYSKSPEEIKEKVRKGEMITAYAYSMVKKEKSSRRDHLCPKGYSM